MSTVLNATKAFDDFCQGGGILSFGIHNDGAASGIALPKSTAPHDMFAKMPMAIPPHLRFAAKDAAGAPAPKPLTAAEERAVTAQTGIKKYDNRDEIDMRSLAAQKEAHARNSKHHVAFNETKRTPHNPRVHDRAHPATPSVKGGMSAHKFAARFSPV